MSSLTSIAAVKAALSVFRTAHHTGHTNDSAINSWHLLLNRIGTFHEPTAGFATPTTANSCDRNTQGAMVLPTDPGGGKMFRVARARSSMDGSSTPRCMVVIADRLAEIGGLVWNSTALQPITMSLPARYPTNGDGVWIALEDLSVPNTATTTTMTVNYTNQAGAASSTTVTTTPQAAHTGTTHFMEYAPGDTGVQTITGVQLSVNGGTTAGNIGLSLVQPLIMFDASQRSSQANQTGNEIEDWLDCALAQIDPQACLQVMLANANPSGGSMTGLIRVELDLVID